MESYKTMTGQPAMMFTGSAGGFNNSQLGFDTKQFYDAFGTSETRITELQFDLLLARATLGQMVIRIALQCNETDAHPIMDDDKPAPRMLTRPGEGIYNDQAGALAANSPFQIVWLPEDERDAVLDRVADHF